MESWQDVNYDELPPNGAPEDSKTTEPAKWKELLEDGSAIVIEVLPPVVEIVQGIVAERSKLVIASSSKSFKTWLTMDLALSISCGVPFLERRTTRQRVLFINLELKPVTFKRRVQAITEARGLTLEPGWFKHLSLRGKLSGLTVHAAVDRIIALAKELGAGVIILDPIYKLNLEGEENNSRDQTLFFNQLDRITTDAAATLILNDHSGKGNQSEKDPLDVIRGSSAKGGDVDAAMVLRRHDVDNCFRVDLVHRELAPVEPFTIGWEYPLMILKPDLNPDAMRQPGAGRKREHDPVALLRAIATRTKENPVSVSQWAALAKIHRSTLSGYLNEMRSLGWIATVGEGAAARQFITEKGLEML